MEACSEDIRIYCNQEVSTENIKKCLTTPIKNPNNEEEHEIHLTEKCVIYMFQDVIEETKDIRLNEELNEKCKIEQMNFCKNVEYGDGEVKQCLYKERVCIYTTHNLFLPHVYLSFNYTPHTLSLTFFPFTLFFLDIYWFQ